MRKLIEWSSWLVFVLVVTLTVQGCRRQERARLEVTEEEPPALASVVHVADPATATQLLKGFHGIEQGSWRWTAGSFAVALRPPAHAAERGARLEVRFSIPEVVLAKLKTMTLRTTVDGADLAPETFSKPGDHVYTREIPPSAFTAKPVVVEFALDKTFSPGGGDQRELGLVLTTIGLEAK
jgi:hypothetical protein